MINLATYHTITAQPFVNGVHIRPLAPPLPEYRLHTLPDGRSLYIAPSLPESSDELLASWIMATYPVPAEFMK